MFPFSREEQLLILTACKQVVKEVHASVSDTSHHMQLMKAAALLVLFGLKVCSESEQFKEKEDIEMMSEIKWQSLKELVQLLSEWIGKRAVSGAFAFTYNKQKKLKEELKVCCFM